MTKPAGHGGANRQLALSAIAVCSCWAAWAQPAQRRELRALISPQQFAALGTDDIVAASPVGLRLAQAPLPPPPARDPGLIDDFETDVEYWMSALKRVEDPVKQGRRAGVWDLTKITALKNLSVPRDWSPFGRLDFWCHTVEPTGAAFLLIVFSENGASTGPDYYWLPLKVDWSGWKRFELPYRAFRPNREPLGWDRVSGLALYSSGYRDCVEVPGTKLTLDDMRLVAPNAEAGCVLGDFEFDTPAWQGLTRDTETKHGGEGSGKWADLQTTKLVRCTSVPHDWTGWDNLELWVHSATANQQQVKVLLYSDNPQTEGIDSYLATFVADWEGWRQLRFSKHRDFEVSRSPRGWDHLDHVTLGGNGWGIEPKPDTVLHFDDLRLTKDPWTPTLVVSDMEEQQWPWLGLERDEAQAKEGRYAGKWADTKKTPFIRITRIPHDWTTLEALTFWCYSAVANNAPLKLLLYSDDPGTEKTDCYGFLLRVDWQGWKFLTVRKEQFSPNHSLVGWRKIDCLTIGADGWGLKALPDTCLWLDEVRLVRKSPEHPANEGRPAATAGRTTGDRSRKLVAGERK